LPRGLIEPIGVDVIETEFVNEALIKKIESTTSQP
jgi:hypothetical protein